MTILDVVDGDIERSTKVWISSREKISDLECVFKSIELETLRSEAISEEILLDFTKHLDFDTNRFIRHKAIALATDKS